jgi:hypothetical protein
MLTWRLKWWQSGLFGAAIGLAFFFCQQNYPRRHFTEWSEKSFFQGFQNYQDGAMPPFKDIVIEPQIDGAYTVTCLLFSNPDFKKIQFEVTPGRDGFVPVLRTYAARYAWLNFQYLWWREPRLLIWVYPLFGAFVLGVMIPYLTFLWTGGAPIDSEKPYDLNRFEQTPKDATPATAGMTIEKSQELDAAIAAAQQASLGAPDSGAVGRAAVPQEAPVRKLDGKPLEAPAPATAQPDKDFDGEFYPTEVHHHEPKPKPNPK